MKSNHHLNKKQVIFLCIVGAAAVLGMLMLFAEKERSQILLEPIKNSYYENLNKVLQQLNSERPKTTITGNNHGPFHLIFLGHLGYFLKIDNPMEVSFRYSEFWHCVLALVFPFLLWKLLGYRPLSIIGGILLMLEFVVKIQTTSAPTIYYSYWSGGCFTLLCCPILAWLVMRAIKNQFDRNEWFFIALLIVLMAFENTIRQHFAFPVLVCLLLVFLLRIIGGKSRERILGALLAVVACVTFLYAPPAAKKLYDLTVHQVDVQTVERPWHGIWCGLGVFENEFGFAWNDTMAAEYVASVDPTAEYCSEEYFVVLRVRVITVFRENPGWVLKTIFHKFTGSIEEVFRFYQKWFATAIVCLICTAAWLIRMKSAWDDWFWPAFLIGLVCMLAGTLQGVVGHPESIVYLLPSMAGCVFMVLSCLLQAFAVFWPLFVKLCCKVQRKLFPEREVPDES